jgi:hypothetical protein
MTDAAPRAAAVERRVGGHAPVLFPERLVLIRALRR